ncbi:MAG: transporter substrate-binding domain-containing protein, partial [Sedimentitalea sp.]
REIYAMLAYGVCDVIPGFALYETSLGAFYKTRGALPRWDDRPTFLGPEVQVDLEPISVSDPYARMEMGVAFRDESVVREIEVLADMEGLRVGVEQGTLAGVLTLRQGTEAMTENSVTLTPGPDFLWRMEQGDFDAALVTVGAFDFHKKQNFVSTMVLGDYRHPIGFNLSIAMLKRNNALMTKIDPLIGEMLADGRMEQLGKKAKHSFAPPRKPYVQRRLSMRDIMGTR